VRLALGLLALVALAIALAPMLRVRLLGRRAPEVEPPARAVADLVRSEEAAARLEGALLTGLVGPLAGAEIDVALELFDKDFAGALFGTETNAEGSAGRAAPVSDGRLVWTRLEPGGPTLDARALLERVADHVGGWDRYARLEAEADAFRLDADDPEQAYARVELRWAGWRSITRAEPLDGGVEAPLAGDVDADTRTDVRLVCELRARLTADVLQVEALRLVRGSVLEGVARFRDVAREVGFTWAESARNRALAQDFIDEHFTLALGGLSVVDFNRDGAPDILATRAGATSTCFLNDQRGGFRPVALPPANANEHPALFLYVDLDGDGREELVGSRPAEYEGAYAYIGLWTRRTEGGPWEYVPRAFELPNPVGLRRLAVQTIVPFDMERDGDLDLFVAVYGSSTSRGERYNTVDAADGADNFLLVNHGGLRFTEESDSRGITGTRYTYIATAFDFDADGDVDVFEGNDFGPNVLWSNDGEGHFTADTTLGFGGVPAYTMGATIADFDNSGKWSLYVSNMSSEQGARMVPIAGDLGEAMRAVVATIARGNMLYTEGEPGAPWREHAVALGVNEGEWAWGCIFVDADNDADRDLFVTNGFTSHRERARGDFQSQYWRQVIADGAALERGERAPNQLTREGATSFNGYERDRLFLNLGPGAKQMTAAPQLPDAAFVLGLDADHDGRAVVPLDMDGDGDLDLALWSLQGLVLFENLGDDPRATSPPRANWVRLELVSKTGQGPPLGAVATVIAGGVRQRDYVKLIDGFQSQVLPELHFGLGAATHIESVEVSWTDGNSEIWRDLAVGRRHVLVQGASATSSAPLLGTELARWSEASRPEGGTPRVQTLLPRDGGGFEAPAAPGRVLVVRVARAGASAWPLAEALAPSHAEVRFVRVLIGGTWNGEADCAVVEANLLGTDPWLREALGPRFTRAYAKSGSGGALGSSATLVFDAEGVLVRTFRGEPSVIDLEAALAAAADEPAVPSVLVEHGRRALSEHRYREAAALFQESLALYDGDSAAWEGLGRAHVNLGRLDLAEEAYAASVRVDPDYGIGHFNLGVTRTNRGRAAEAIPALQESLRIEGKLRRTLLALGEAAAAADQLELALATYGDVLALDPRDAGAEVARGKLFARLTRFPEARASLQRALALDPANAEARAALAKVEQLDPH